MQKTDAMPDEPVRMVVSWREYRGPHLRQPAFISTLECGHETPHAIPGERFVRCSRGAALDLLVLRQ